MLTDPRGGGHFRGPKNQSPTLKIFPVTPDPPRGGGGLSGPRRGQSLFDPKIFSRAPSKITLFNTLFLLPAPQAPKILQFSQIGPTKMHFWALFGPFPPQKFFPPAPLAPGGAPAAHPPPGGGGPGPSSHPPTPKKPVTHPPPRGGGPWAKQRYAPDRASARKK